MLHWVVAKAMSCYWWYGYVLSNSNVLFYSFILYNMWKQSGEVLFRSGRWHRYWSVSCLMLRTWIWLPSAHMKSQVARTYLYSSTGRQSKLVLEACWPTRLTKPLNWSLLGRHCLKRWGRKQLREWLLEKTSSLHSFVILFHAYHTEVFIAHIWTHIPYIHTLTLIHTPILLWKISFYEY